MLQTFANEVPVWLAPKKRVAKLSTKMAQQALACEFLTMQEELGHLVSEDNNIARVLNDCRKLQS
jgi:hypothetical protein